ncbi:MAG: acyltransferase family protein [Janthinobacterium lividum]
MMLKREVFIDHLRGFVFAFMAFDHVIHAYAQNWGRFWFIQDFDRSTILDMIYLFDQSLIMPLLFFLVGLNVLPSLHRHGFQRYLKNRFIKLAIPFLFCIPLIVPLLSFPRYQLTIDPTIDFITYWRDIFFTQKLQAGPLWVCYAIFLYSFILILLNRRMPSFIPKMGAWVRDGTAMVLILTILGFSIIILTLSDIVWGAPWWIGFWKVFYLQASRFLLYFLYLILGASVRASGLFDNQNFMQRFSQRWWIWLSLTVIAGLAYSGYATVYIDQGAYSDTFRLQAKEFFDQGGAWSDFGSFVSSQGFDVLTHETPDVLIRTALHALLCLCQVLFLISLFYRFCNTPTPVWQSLARCCYAIFLTHEAMVIWLQYYFIGNDLPILMKIIIIFILGFGGSWLMSEKILLRIKPLRRVLN